MFIPILQKMIQIDEHIHETSTWMAWNRHQLMIHLEPNWPLFFEGQPSKKRPKIPIKTRDTYSSDGLNPPDLDDEPLGIIQTAQTEPQAHHAPSRLRRWKNSEKKSEKDGIPIRCCEKDFLKPPMGKKKQSIATKNIQNNWKSNKYHLGVHKKKLENGSIPQCVGNSWICFSGDVLLFPVVFMPIFHQHLGGYKTCRFQNILLSKQIQVRKGSYASRFGSWLWKQGYTLHKAMESWIFQRKQAIPKLQTPRRNHPCKYKLYIFPKMTFKTFLPGWVVKSTYQNWWLIYYPNSFIYSTLFRFAEDQSVHLWRVQCHAGCCMAGKGTDPFFVVSGDFCEITIGDPIWQLDLWGWRPCSFSSIYSQILVVHVWGRKPIRFEHLHVETCPSI